MKKLFVLFLTALLALSMVACSSSSEDTATTEGTETGATVVDKLTIAFVPSKDAEEILTAAEPLENMLKEKLAARGFEVGAVDLTVTTDYNAAGEGMIAGSIDIGFLPAGTYVLYQPDGVNLLLEALRYGFVNNEGTVLDPSLGIEPWNSGTVEQAKDGLVTGYASLIYVNVATEKGAELYEKATAGTLTWDDVNSAKWEVGKDSSSAGYVYPSIWLNNNFGEGAGSSKVTVANLDHLTPAVGYPDMIKHLIAGTADVTCSFADYRINDDANEAFAAAYAAELADGTYETIFDVIKVIGVTDYIMNDTISVADESVDPKMTPELVKALEEAFIEIGSTEEGLACVAPYSHMGYRVGADSDYDSSRAANSLFTE